MGTKQDDDDDDEADAPQWILAHWNCNYNLSLSFVARVEGKPRADYWPTSDLHTAYRWRSYHAARKFQKTHKRLGGYVILNLTAIQEQAAMQRILDDEWVNRER